MDRHRKSIFKGSLPIRAILLNGWRGKIVTRSLTTISSLLPGTKQGRRVFNEREEGAIKVLVKPQGEVRTGALRSKE